MEHGSVFCAGIVGHGSDAGRPASSIEMRRAPWGYAATSRFALGRTMRPSALLLAWACALLAGFPACDSEGGTSSQDRPEKPSEEGVEPEEIPEAVLPEYVWVSPEELQRLPMSGPAWQNLVEAATVPALFPRLRDQNDKTDTTVLAKALVHARRPSPVLRAEVVQACMAAIGTELGGSTLALGRNLPGYVIAADLVGLTPDDDTVFRAWLRTKLSAVHERRSLRSTHEDRPNNWGTHAGGARACIAAYLGDRRELRETARVFLGYLGGRRFYSGFEYGSLDWQADGSTPVGINPAGARRDGHSIDGVLPDEQRRGGGFEWPPPHENYVYEGLQGALLQAVVLGRAGYDVWSWEDQALLRAYRWLHEEAAYPATGDDVWQIHVVNAVYNTDFPAEVGTRPGKNIGWTDWSHGSVD